jgi:excisionase family DNA binding protein
LSTNLPDANDWVSQAEAARIRGITRQAIGRLIKKGRLKTLRIGGKVLVFRTEVEAFKPEPAGRPSNDRKDRIVKTAD